MLLPSTLELSKCRIRVAHCERARWGRAMTPTLMLSSIDRLVYVLSQKNYIHHSTLLTTFKTCSMVQRRSRICARTPRRLLTPVEPICKRKHVRDTELHGSRFDNRLQGKQSWVVMPGLMLLLRLAPRTASMHVNQTRFCSMAGRSHTLPAAATNTFHRWRCVRNGPGSLALSESYTIVVVKCRRILCYLWGTAHLHTYRSYLIKQEAS